MYYLSFQPRRDFLWFILILFYSWCLALKPSAIRYSVLLLLVSSFRSSLSFDGNGFDESNCRLRGIFYWDPIANSTPPLGVFPSSGILSFLVIWYSEMRSVPAGVNRVSVTIAISMRWSFRRSF